MLRLLWKEWHDARWLMAAPIEQVKARVKRLVVTFPSGAPEKVEIPGVIQMKRTQRQIELTISRSAADLTKNLTEIVSGLNYSEVEIEDLSLEDILVALVGKRVYES